MGNSISKTNHNCFRKAKSSVGLLAAISQRENTSRI